MSATVCVGLAVRNGSRYLASAIESVLAQDGVDLALHIIDNCSDDDSVEIACRYDADPRVTVSVNEEDILYYGSLNRVLEQTDAEYFVPFACDDRMLAGNLRRKVQAASTTGAALVHSTALWMDETGRLGAPVIDHRLTPPVCVAPGFFGHLVPHNRVICPSALVRVDVLRALGGFDGRNDFAADWLAWLQIALRGSVVTLDEPLVAYRAHPQSGTSRAERLGLRGFYEPATIEHILSDDRFPAEWDSWRERLLAMTCAHVAGVLHDTGSRRLADGWAGYMLAARALALMPHDVEMAGRFQSLVEAAGLVVPGLPALGVAMLPESDADAAALRDGAHRLGALLDRLVIPIEPERQTEALTRLEPVFGDDSIEGVILPCPAPERELVAGRLALLPWGSPLTAVAESAGVPVWPIGAPTPFAHAADPARWETLAGRPVAGATR